MKTIEQQLSGTNSQRSPAGRLAALLEGRTHAAPPSSQSRHQQYQSCLCPCAKLYQRQPEPPLAARTRSEREAAAVPLLLYTDVQWLLADVAVPLLAVLRPMHNTRENCSLLLLLSEVSIAADMPHMLGCRTNLQSLEILTCTIAEAQA